MTGKWEEKRNKADSFHLVGIPPFVSYSLSLLHEKEGGGEAGASLIQCKSLKG